MQSYEIDNFRHSNAHRLLLGGALIALLGILPATADESQVVDEDSGLKNSSPKNSSPKNSSPKNSSPKNSTWEPQGVTFHDLVEQPDSGIDFRRTRSAHSVIWDQFVAGGTISFFTDLPFTPTFWRGKPGVAILDYDKDGDLDLYVTNGPGTDNSLYANQLYDTGELRFVERADIAGVAANGQDSSGVCFGDTDNDGDHDLLVLSNVGPNRFFENHGDGIFGDLSNDSGLGVDDRASYSCSFGDANGDGLIDVAIGNSIDDPSNLLGLVTPFQFTQHNQLFLNTGNNAFVDVSVSSGLVATRGLGPFDGSPGVTWAITMVDYDQDGDTDIIHADEQGGVPRADQGGIDWGFIHVFENDGSGQFTDVSVERNTRQIGIWMGLAFGDLNEDGYMDLFGTNLGDYAATITTPLDPFFGDFGTYELGEGTSRWLLGGPGGVFTDPGVGDLVATPFGWGSSMFDYDNDADTDIIFHGSLGFGPIIHDGNPGSLLRNDGAANFTYDQAAMATSTDHRRRTVHGVAVGDLNDDGFGDMVTTSNFDKQPSIPLNTYNVEWGSPFDSEVAFQATFVPSGVPGLTVFSGIEDNVDGTLAVEINSADNGQHWIKVELLGTIGLTSGGGVNRDALGAVVSVETRDGRRTLRPVTGGASHLSQDSLVLDFGLGYSRRATVDVLWPGGVRNRLYNARKGSRLVFPEIPCSYDDETIGFPAYRSCVRGALNQLIDGGHLTRAERAKFFISALFAFFEHRY